jgi:Putative Ig domain
VEASFPASLLDALADLEIPRPFTNLGGMRTRLRAVSGGALIWCLLTAWGTLSGASTPVQQPTSLTWGEGPALAALTGSPATAFTDVSCGSVCVAVGYLDDGTSTSALLATNSSGTWEMQELPTTLNGTDARLNSVSCLASTCTAVGTFDNGGFIQAFVAQGTPSGWTETPLTTSLPQATDVSLQSISCVASGCTGAGSYSDGSSVHSFLLTENGTDWTETPVTRAANGADGDQLASVSCSSSLCAAVGTLTSTDPSSKAVTTQAFWTSSSNGWVEVPISTIAPEQDASLAGVRCTTTCTAVGTANQQDATDGLAIVVSDLTNGGSEAIVANPVADAVNTSLTNLSCGDSGCVAAGSSSESGQTVPFFASNVSGNWEAWSPPLQDRESDTAITGLSCASMDCVGVGSTVSNGFANESMYFSAQTLQFSTLPSEDGQVGVPYASRVATSGGTGTATYEVSSGQLPAGLELDANTGEITGTPTTPGTSTFTISSTDVGPLAQTISTPVSLTIAAAPAPAVGVASDVGTSPSSLAETGADLRMLLVSTLLLAVAGAGGLGTARGRKARR